MEYPILSAFHQRKTSKNPEYMIEVFHPRFVRGGKPAANEFYS